MAVACYCRAVHQHVCVLMCRCGYVYVYVKNVGRMWCAMPCRRGGDTGTVMADGHITWPGSFDLLLEGCYCMHELKGEVLYEC